MVTCPTCGKAVLEGQRFCGNCGTDVPAALAAAVPPARGSASLGEDDSSPYAYQSQGGYGSSPSGYGYEPISTEPPAGGRLMIIVGALILAICCAFACGLLFGFELIPTLLQSLGIMSSSGPAVPPRPTTAPTPSTLLPIIQYFIG